jgi:hypothetical protein
MKKLLIIPLFLLFGCEIYEQPSAPSVAGIWKFTDYYVTKFGEISPTEIITNDTICINSFSEQSFVSGGKYILMKQNYGNTVKDRRFIKNVTTWDFDGPTGSTFFPLLVNNEKNDVTVKFPIYMENEFTKMVVSNNYGYVSNYIFFTSGKGANYSNKLTLTSSPITTDLYLSDGKRTKAITVTITLIFTRFT